MITAPAAGGPVQPDVSTALVTDLYEVTMAASYLREGMTAPATFSLFVRHLPPNRGFLVAAGLSDALDRLARFRIEDAEVEAFASALDVRPEAMSALRGTRFTGDVWAVPEGRIVLAGEPLVEVTSPLPEAQLVETTVLNAISTGTMLASKAARSVIAANGRPVIDFSLRRTHGLEAGMLVARCAAMVGFAGTSNVAAARAYGYPAVGTMAHSYVEAFPTEEDAFRAFARSCPSVPVTFLVDTYDTRRGVVTAARVMRDMQLPPGSGVRLDSGDLAALARMARSILDAEGLPDARIVVSGGLDEFAVERLVAEGAPVDVFAVGTKVGVSADAPYLDAAYKLVEYDGRPVMKLSEGKVTAPGAKQVWRRPGPADEIALRDELDLEGEPLLQRVVQGGRVVVPEAVDLDAARRRFTDDLAAMPSPARRVTDPEPPVASPSRSLTSLVERLQQDLRTVPS